MTNCRIRFARLHAAFREAFQPLGIAFGSLYPAIATTGTGGITHERERDRVAEPFSTIRFVPGRAWAAPTILFRPPDDRFPENWYRKVS